MGRSGMHPKQANREEVASSPCKHDQNQLKCRKKEGVQGKSTIIHSGNSSRHEHRHRQPQKGPRQAVSDACTQNNIFS